MRFFIYIACLLFFNSLFAQNLVINSDFEDRNCCPEDFSQFGCTNTWSRPSEGTSDYFSACKNRFDSPVVKVPDNFIGNQEAYNGEAYAGIYVFYPKTSYREYLQAFLKSPLIAGETYCIEVPVSLADSVGLSVAELGISFSNIKTKQLHHHQIRTQFIPLKNSDSSQLNSKSDWTILKTEYLAKGGEQYLLIGNFYDNFQTDTSSVNSVFNPTEKLSSYYYIDAVCLVPKEVGEPCSCEEEKPIFQSDSSYVELFEFSKKIEDPLLPKVGERVILKNIYFQTAKASLLPQSLDELQKLYGLLIKYPNMKIEISGHTDSEGKSDYNQGLSEARAQTVYTWLLNQGVSRERIQFKGFGELRPIDTNHTDIGRQNNRRVEFEVLEN